ncbi:MAG TPA: DUF3450 domain-containing protein [Desulfohalobiaceae bacterium]|nr:DUF3450 domain-containing protein [Desulfohalobiaceae bacterium]
MSRNISLIVSSIIFFLSFSFVNSWAEVHELEEKTKSAIQKKLDVQEMADEWIKEKEAIINEMRQMHNEKKWYDFQTKKFQKYIAKQQEKLKRMREDKQELEEMQLKLEPYLKERVSHLDKFIDKDLPFLTESRKAHINYLRESIYDPDLTLTEKLQRVIKAYQREAKYGKTIGAEVRELKRKGNTFKANVLRIGRLKLFYMSMDGKHVGMWDPSNKAWESIDSKYKRSIQKTIDIANQQKTVELVTLPVGGLEE